MSMSIRGIIILVVCVLGGVISLLVLGETAGAHWNTTATAVVPVSVLAIFFIIVIAAIVHMSR